MSIEVEDLKFNEPKEEETDLRSSTRLAGPVFDFWGTKLNSGPIESNISFNQTVLAFRVETEFQRPETAEPVGRTSSHILSRWRRTSTQKCRSSAFGRESSVIPKSSKMLPAVIPNALLKNTFEIHPLLLQLRGLSFTLGKIASFTFGIHGVTAFEITLRILLFTAIELDNPYAWPKISGVTNDKKNKKTGNLKEAELEISIDHQGKALTNRCTAVEMLRFYPGPQDARLLFQLLCVESIIISHGIWTKIKKDYKNNLNELSAECILQDKSLPKDCKKIPHATDIFTLENKLKRLVEEEVCALCFKTLEKGILVARCGHCIHIKCLEVLILTQKKILNQRGDRTGYCRSCQIGFSWGPRPVRLHIAIAVLRRLERRICKKFDSNSKSDFHDLMRNESEQNEGHTRKSLFNFPDINDNNNTNFAKNMFKNMGKGNVSVDDDDHGDNHNERFLRELNKERSKKQEEIQALRKKHWEHMLPFIAQRVADELGTNKNDLMNLDPQRTTIEEYFLLNQIDEDHIDSMTIKRNNERLYREEQQRCIILQQDEQSQEKDEDQITINKRMIAQRKSFCSVQPPGKIQQGPAGQSALFLDMKRQMRTTHRKSVQRAIGKIGEMNKEKRKTLIRD